MYDGVEKKSQDQVLKGLKGSKETEICFTLASTLC